MQNNFSNTAVKIASNTIYQIIGKVVSMSITVLAVVIITRAYGKIGYGEFSLMQTWPALFFIIVDFGLNAIGTRELSKDWSKANKLIGNIFLIRFFLSAVCIGVLSLLLIFFPYTVGLKIGIGVSLLLILTQALFATTNIVFQVKLRYDYSTIGYIGGYILILLLIILFSYFKLPIFWISFTYIVGGVLTFILNYLFMRKLGVFPDFTFDKTLSKQLLWSSLPLGLMFFFSQVNFKSDTILMSVMDLPKIYGLNGTETVAIYSLAYKVFEVALVVPTFFMNSVYPVLVRHMEEGKERLKKTFVRSLFFLFVSGIISGLVGYILSPWIISVLGGSEFTQSVAALRILVSGMVIYFLTQPISWLIVTLDKQKYLPYIYLISAVFNVSMNVIFIPKYSYLASSWITHASELLILILLSVFAHRAWKLKYVE